MVVIHNSNGNMFSVALLVKSLATHLLNCRKRILIAYKYMIVVKKD